MPDPSPQLPLMPITAATPSDIDAVLACLTSAFAEDPITGFLLQAGPGYQERLTRFFSLLLRARIALGMPVLVARGVDRIQGAAMGNVAAPRPWPDELEQEWTDLESTIPGFRQRAETYDGIAEASRPAAPHYYLGVIGTDPALRGRGIGRQLLQSFCALSAADRASAGVYLETANPSNVPFYERAGFVVTGQGQLGDATLWCLFLAHPRPGDP